MTAALVVDPPWVVDVAADEIREGFLEILPVADQGRVITVIELLSPSNKAAGGTGRPLLSGQATPGAGHPTHLLEIDLLRQVRTPSRRVARDRLKRRGAVRLPRQPVARGPAGPLRGLGRPAATAVAPHRRARWRAAIPT
jgi:hypothetical protein